MYASSEYIYWSFEKEWKLFNLSKNYRRCWEPPTDKRGKHMPFEDSCRRS